MKGKDGISRALRNRASYACRRGSSRRQEDSEDASTGDRAGFAKGEGGLGMSER